MYLWKYLSHHKLNVENQGSGTNILDTAKLAPDTRGDGARGVTSNPVWDSHNQVPAGANVILGCSNAGSEQLAACSNVLTSFKLSGPFLY